MIPAKALAHSAFVFLSWFMVGCIVTPCFLIMLCLPTEIRHQSKALFWICSQTSRIVLKALGPSVEVSGTLPEGRFVIVANHTSMLDFLPIEALLKDAPRIWIAKKEIDTIPLFGFLMRRLHILIDRHNKIKAMRSLAQTVKQAKTNNAHVIIFPEGTRSLDGTIARFKQGAGILAKKLGYQLLPIHIEGTHSFFPNGNLIDSSRQPIKLTIGSPVTFHENETTEECMVRLRSWFVKQTS